MSLKQIAPTAFAALLIGVLASTAYGQTTAPKGASGQTTPSSASGTAGGGMNSSGMSKASGAGMAKDGSSGGGATDCPAGQARTAAPDGTKGPCKAQN